MTAKQPADKGQSGGDITPSDRRLDKWLWFARFFKTRSLATKFCQAGKLRVNSQIIAKAHYTLKVGDVLTFPLRHHVRVIKVADLGHRRGPAPEAQALYEDLAPPQPRAQKEDNADQPRPVAVREPGSGRPTKRQRRDLERLRGDFDEP